MYHELYKYLILYKKVGIPGIGTFSIMREPAKFDFANKIFDAPVFQIYFNPDADVADNGIYAFISNGQNVEQTEAIKQLGNFADSLKKILSINKGAELPGLGKLLQSDKGELRFQSIQQLKDYFPDITAERVMRENTQHNVLVGESNRTNTEMQEILATEPNQNARSKDYWWIYAIILAVISIAAIIYYYYLQALN